MAPAPPRAAAKQILKVSDLKKYFPVRSAGLGILPRVVGQVKAVDGISFDLDAGETLGLVGESGCGKSTAGRTILRLLTPTAGKVEIDGEDVSKLSTRQLVPFRRKAQIIFQDPYNALNPRHTVGTIIGAPFAIQGVKPPGGVKNAVYDLMERVGLNPEHYNRYPNEFSGGQRQRIGIARAVALRPQFIVCDEPVSALDVSIQAQILNLLRDLQEDFGVAYLFVAHDLAVVRQISHRVAVMYLGHIMELAPRRIIYTAPLHPYTHSLLSAVPIPDPARQKGRTRILLQGDLPSPIDPPSGCVFRTRCFQAQEKCAVEVPPLVEIAPGHQIACHFPVQVKDLPKRIEVEDVGADDQAATLAPTVEQNVGVGAPHA
ncbi:MAG TPA: oligopeptide/dipeptide ABC transporter ATP-binding protein [Candidatus Dormibacteraeota bacterium]|nr:oligopeptide/dipeptide ABC transporter ATP-binding protein [Candidatus Dormibacteraeota bacterium]